MKNISTLENGIILYGTSPIPTIHTYIERSNVVQFRILFVNLHENAFFKKTSCQIFLKGMQLQRLLRYPKRLFAWIYIHSIRSNCVIMCRLVMESDSNVPLVKKIHIN